MPELIDRAIEGGIPVLLVVAGLVFLFVAITEIEKIKVPSVVSRYLLGGIGVALLVVGISTYFSELSGRGSDNSPSEDTSNVADDNEILPNWFSSGERAMFIDSNEDRDFGISAFKKGEYKDAAVFFEQATEADRSDPESQIYLNNSKIREDSSRVVLATVVPIDNEKDLAEQILRGVADSQTECNANQNNQNTPIEILIVNDANDIERVPKISGEIIDKQIKKKEIMGVIGHLSSSVTGEALKVYGENSLATISPTSTSDFLKNEVFFRTPPPDKLNGQKLAQYVIETLGEIKVAVLYNPDDDYSESLQRAFKKEFEYLGGTVQLEHINVEKLDANKFIESLTDEIEAIVLLPDTDWTDRAVAIARANKDVNAEKSLPLFGGDSLYSSDLLSNGGLAVKGLVISSPWFSSNNSAYANAAYARWGGQVSWETAMGFDAAQAFCSAIAGGKTMSRSEIVDALKNEVTVFASSTGVEFSFDSNGNTDRDPILVEVVDAAEYPSGEVATPNNTKYGFHPIDKKSIL